MACEILSTHGAVFVLWGKPTAADMDSVINALQMGVDRCGKPVVYVTRVPEDAPPPDAAARVHLNQLMPRMLSLCASYHVVLEGDGFGVAVKRGILTGLFQLSWRRKPFFVHSALDEIAPKVTPEHQRAVASLLALASARGLVAGLAPVSLSPP